MKKSKLSEAQIVALLNEGSVKGSVEATCRKYQIAKGTYYKLKAKYGGMNTSDLKRLKALEEENRQLKQMYADISLRHNVLKEVLAKKYPELIGKR